MALIICPECHKEISDKSPQCIHCGYPIQKNSSINSDSNNLYTVVLNNIGNDRTLTIRTIREIKHINIKPAMEIVDNVPSVISSNVSLNEAKEIQEKFSKIGALTSVKEFNHSDDLPTQTNNIIHCPHCGSTAVTTGQKGFSLLTGFLGSNKTVNRCGKCGWSWQPK